MFNKKIIISLLIVVLGGFIWFFYSSSTDTNISSEQNTSQEENIMKNNDLVLDFESVEPIISHQPTFEKDKSKNINKNNEETNTLNDEIVNNKVTVKYPIEGEMFSVGSSFEILWGSEGNIENVDIRLKKQPFSCDGDNFCESLLKNDIPRYIADDTENDGVYDWKISEDISPGKYVIEVLNSNRLYNDIDESNIFSITNPEEEINIVFPVSEYEIYNDQSYTIVWSGGKSLFYVDIIIKKIDNNQEILIAESLRNENYFVWDVDDSLDPGKYNLIIKGVDSHIKSESIIIEIK